MDANELKVLLDISDDVFLLTNINKIEINKTEELIKFKKKISNNKKIIKIIF